MPNPNAITLNLNTELGQAIKAIISKTDFGESMFIVQEFLINHKQELIELWNNQGKDGVKEWDKWHSKWSMTKTELNLMRQQEAQQKFIELSKKYELLGHPREEAVELAKSFPDEDPIKFEQLKLKGKSTDAFVKQTDTYVEKSEDKKAEKEQKEQRQHDYMQKQLRESSKGKSLLIQKEGSENCLKDPDTWFRPESVKCSKEEWLERQKKRYEEAIKGLKEMGVEEVNE